MKISTKAQYALEALIDLQLHASGGPECLKNIAERRGISEPYLNQIFSSLRKDGIVESIRGAQGGFRLAKRPEEITAGDILRSTEGPLAPVKCVASCSDGQSSCSMAGVCVTRLLWAKTAQEIDRAVDSVTLADLTGTCARLPAQVSQEYSI